MKAIYRYSSDGPTFDYGYDLHITDNAVSRVYSYANIGNSYHLPPGYIAGQNNTQSLLAGGSLFIPSAIEVLSLSQRRELRKPGARVIITIRGQCR